MIKYFCLFIYFQNVQSIHLFSLLNLPIVMHFQDLLFKSFTFLIFIMYESEKLLYNIFSHRIYKMIE